MINSAATSAPAPENSVVPQRTDNASLLRRLEFEHLLSEVSTHFINLSAEEIDRHINQALGRVGSFLGFNLGAISKFSGQGSGCEVTHIWTAAGLPPIPPGFTELDFPWASRSVAQGREVHLTSLDVLPLEAQRDRETYERFGLRSVYNWPLQVGGTVVGILSFASVAKAHGFPTDFEQGLKLLAQVMAGSLARARDDRALRESEAKLSLAADAAGAGLWELNLATHSFWVTKKTRELFAFGADEVVTFDRFLNLVHPEDRELVRRKVQQVLESKGEVQVEYRVLQPDGRVQWMYSRGRVHCDCSGQPVYLMGVTVDATARKKAEEALKASEQRFRILAENSLVGTYVFQDDRYQYVNPAMARVFGYSVAEMTGMTLSQIVQPSDQAMVGENIRRPMSGEIESLCYEVRGRHKDGSTRDVEVYGARLEINGKPALIGTLLDITERKRAEDTLRKNEARLTSAIDAAELGFYEEEGPTGDRRTFMDSRVGHILGIPNDISIGVREYWLEHLHPEDRQLVSETADIFEKKARERVAVEYRFQHPLRGVIWLRHIVHALARNEAGEVIRLIGVFQEITERKRAEEALKESEARLASAVEVAGLGFYEMSSDPTRIFVDEHLRSMLGLTAQDAHRVQEFWMEHIHSDDRERVAEVSRRVLGGEQQSATVEYRYEHPARGTLWFSHVSRVQEQEATGKVVRRLGVIRDITKQRQAELESQQLRGNLAHVSRVSTLGELAASVAHELNQPLGAILANAEAAELFLEQEPPALHELRPILAAICRDDERAGEVIRRMRNLLRKRELERVPVDINSLVEDVLQLVSGDASLRGVSFSADLAPGLPKVYGDRVHLQQVLLNLIINGMDAIAGQARERRRMWVRTRAGAENQVELAVLDSGQGVDPEKLKRLFEPFYTTKANGMGMGLSIARTIIEAHHGRIWAENNTTGGAAFRIVLPTAKPGRGAGGTNE